MLKELKRDKEEDAEVLQSLEDELLKEYPSHLPLLSAVLASLTSLPAEKQNKHLQVTSRPALMQLLGYAESHLHAAATQYIVVHASRRP